LPVARPELSVEMVKVELRKEGESSLRKKERNKKREKERKVKMT
jgi:hypothetical protein